MLKRRISRFAAADALPLKSQVDLLFRHGHVNGQSGKSAFPVYVNTNMPAAKEQSAENSTYSIY
jgi:hypothetical protein